MKEKVHVRLSSERAPSYDPALVEVYYDEELVCAIQAKIVHEKGADDGYYRVVKLEEVKILS